MKYAAYLISILAVLASACAAPGPGTNNQAAGNVAANTAAEANSSAGNSVAATPGPLSAYVGQPIYGEVEGLAFVNHPLVRSAVEAAVADAAVRRWVLRSDVTTNPIALRDGRLVATGCESGNCGPHHWTILIDPAGTSAEVCYARNTDLTRSAWYVGGRPAEERPGDCPTSG